MTPGTMRNRIITIFAVFTLISLCPARPGRAEEPPGYTPEQLERALSHSITMYLNQYECDKALPLADTLAQFKPDAELAYVARINCALIRADTAAIQRALVDALRNNTNMIVIYKNMAEALYSMDGLSPALNIMIRMEAYAKQKLKK